MTKFKLKINLSLLNIIKTSPKYYFQEDLSLYASLIISAFNFDGMQRSKNLKNIL